MECFEKINSNPKVSIAGYIGAAILGFVMGLFITLLSTQDTLSAIILIVNYFIFVISVYFVGTLNSNCEFSKLNEFWYAVIQFEKNLLTKIKF